MNCCLLEIPMFILLSFDLLREGPFEVSRYQRRETRDRARKRKREQEKKKRKKLLYTNVCRIKYEK